MHVGLAAVGMLLATALPASAQGLEITNGRGVSGAHFNIELPAPTTSITHIVTGCTWSYRVERRAYVNGVCKLGQMFDVVGPPPPQVDYAWDLPTGQWCLHPGDLVTIQAKVTDLSGYCEYSDDDWLFGDVVDLVGNGPPDGDGTETHAAIPAAIDERRRFEALFA